MMLAATWKPGCEMPIMPTRPLWFGDVRQQPLDGVVGVGALVDVLRALGRIERPHLLELAFRQVAAARVLVDEDEAVLLEVLGRPERGRYWSTPYGATLYGVRASRNG